MVDAPATVPANNVVDPGRVSDSHSANDKRAVLIFGGAVLLGILCFVVALVIMNWTDTLVFAPVTPTKPDNAFWLRDPNNANRNQAAIDASREVVQSYLDN